MNQPSTPLSEASDTVKLAVDLIYLLETNDVSPQVALEALAIVEQDLKRKLATQPHDVGSTTSENQPSK